MIIQSVRIDRKAMQRCPQLIEAVHYVSAKLPALIGEEPELEHLADQVQSMLPTDCGVFQVLVVDDANEEVVSRDQAMHLFIKDLSKIH